MENDKQYLYTCRFWSKFTFILMTCSCSSVCQQIEALFPSGLFMYEFHLFIYFWKSCGFDRYGEINNIAKTISSRNWFYRRAFYVGFLNMQIKKLLFSFFFNQSVQPSIVTKHYEPRSIMQRKNLWESLVCYRKVG